MSEGESQARVGLCAHYRLERRGELIEQFKRGDIRNTGRRVDSSSFHFQKFPRRQTYWLRLLAAIVIAGVELRPTLG
jgi:hypothetical protein